MDQESKDVDWYREYNTSSTNKSHLLGRKEKRLTSNAFVPLSIKSSFVNTPSVRSPAWKQVNAPMTLKSIFQNVGEKTKTGKIKQMLYYAREDLKIIPVGSTSRAIFIASDVATS